MTTDTAITKELDDLMAEAPELEKLTQKPGDILAFGDKYQLWYSRAVKLVELLGTDRLDEFSGYYRISPKRKYQTVDTYVIQDYVNTASLTDRYRDPFLNVHEVVRVRLVNQSQILNSLRCRIGTVLADVKGHLLAQIEDEELEVARKLLQVSIRAAGAVAGVVLEAHLQRVATNHMIPIAKKDPTISDLNDPLKAAGIYDIPTWRKIQHLTDIRNLCDHKKGREPKEEEVAELIEGVSSTVKTVV